MANIQGRCDFPIGESVMASKLTEIRNVTNSTNEGNNVLTSAEDVTSGLMQAIGRKINSGVETTEGTNLSVPTTCVVLPQISCNNSLFDHQQTYFLNNINTRTIINDVSSLKNNSNVWTDLQAKVDTDNNNVAWQQLSTVGITAPPTELPLYYQIPTIHVEAKQQQIQARENQDLFQNLENVTSNGFDLLSYLCEDDISSQAGSISTDSSRDINGLSKLSNSSPHTVVSPKTYEPVNSSVNTSTDNVDSRFQAIYLPYFEESSTSTKTATSPKRLCTRSPSHPLRTVKLETPDNPSIERRSMRSKRMQMNPNSGHSETSRGMGKKRMLNDESESDDSSYRDTREKNNEASRKSRMNKKAKEQDMAKRAIELEKDNRVLKMKVEELEKLVSSMRNALLRSALKKEIKSNIF